MYDIFPKGSMMSSVLKYSTSRDYEGRVMASVFEPYTKCYEVGKYRPMCLRTKLQACRAGSLELVDELPSKEGVDKLSNSLRESCLCQKKEMNAHRRHY